MTAVLAFCLSVTEPRNAIPLGTVEARGVGTVDKDNLAEREKPLIEYDREGLCLAVKEPVKTSAVCSGYYGQPASYEPGVLTASGGVNYNKNGAKETYYNLDMSVVVDNARANGIEGEYWVRDDGVKMLGDYVIVAGSYGTYGYGEVVDTSLGQGIVLDTGAFVDSNPTQLDIAVEW